MNKEYQAPFIGIDVFAIEDILTVSGNEGIGAGDGVIDTLDDEPIG